MIFTLTRTSGFMKTKLTFATDKKVIEATSCIFAKGFN